MPNNNKRWIDCEKIINSWKSDLIYKDWWNEFCPFNKWNSKEL